MTKLQKEYFATFTLPRLKALYSAVAKEANYSTSRDYNYHIVYYGWSYVTRIWRRPGGIEIPVKFNKRQVRQAIKEREQQLKNQAHGNQGLSTQGTVRRKERKREKRNHPQRRAQMLF